MPELPRQSSVRKGGFAEDDDALQALADLESNEADVCDYAGHEWAPAGGGLLICTVCAAEKWDDER